MNVRLGLILAGSMIVAATGCASGGGTGGAASGGAAPVRSGVPGAALLTQGERPRQNNNTRAAERALEQADEAATPEAARPLYEQALAAAQAGIEADPTNPLSHLQAANAHLGLEQYIPAGAAFDRAEELRPVYTLETEGLRERAWIELYQKAAPMVNEGQYPEAASVFEQANAVYQGRPEVMLTLGAIYFQLQRYDDAIAQFNLARGIIESDRINEMDSATAVSWREQGAEIPVQIAQALIQAGRTAEAATALRQLIADNPDNKLYLQNLASLYIRTEQKDSAAAIYGRMLARTDQDPKELYAIGIGYYQLEDFTKAADAFEAAATKSRTYRDAVELWARSLQIAAQNAEQAGSPPPAPAYQEIQSAAQRWLELDPYSQTALLIIAQSASKQDNQALAREMVDKAETMEVSVEQMTAQFGRDGGVTVLGAVKNLLATQGAPVSFTFRFFDPTGAEVGQQTVRVNAPAVDDTTDFEVDFQSDRQITGYRYELTVG